MLYNNAQKYVRARVELEEKLKEYNRRAAALYKAGKHLEARALWQEMMQKAQPSPILLYFNVTE